MIAGIVFFAFSLETTIGHPSDTLDGLPAAALCGGLALYLLGHIAFLWRSGGRIWRRRSYGAILLLFLIPAVLTIPALAPLSSIRELSGLQRKVLQTRGCWGVAIPIAPREASGLEPPSFRRCSPL
jgi:Bacterial low temperature requirement A protein (LtrA)